MVEASGANSGSNAANPDYNEPSTQNPADSNLPLSSQTDNGLSKRPRDARLLHMVLANYGIIAYQDRVPLQLMDFAYRYTSSTLQDALHFTSEGYGTAAPGATSGKAAAHNDLSGITLSALRLSIASRIHYQFNPTLPKEFYSEIAQDRNRVALPPVSREWGMRLPPEQYCLTGVGWDMKERYDEEMEDADDARERDATIKEEGIEGDEDENDEEEVGRMEDLFGNDGDEDMEE